MKWRTILGAVLLLLTLTLTILLTVKVPFTQTNKFPVDNPIAVSGSGVPRYINVTLEPEGKDDYYVEVTISPYDKSIEFDFWAVNESGLGILDDFLGYGDVFKSEYPDKYPFTLIETYARGINITLAIPRMVHFELTNLTYNGVYYLVFLNFFDEEQGMLVVIEERYSGSPRVVLEPNPAYLTVTAAIFAAGAYLMVKGQKGIHRKTRLQLKNLIIYLVGSTIYTTVLQKQNVHDKMQYSGIFRFTR